MSKYSLNKSDRLKSKSIIDGLFANSQTVKGFPVLILWTLTPLPELDAQPTPIKAAFTVSKKKFRRAVDRNRIKRLMREALRLNRHSLSSAQIPVGFQLNIMMFYLTRDILTFEQVDRGMIKALKRLAHKFESR